MPTRDFFAFCTSLHPVELRALGALSQARHLPEAQTIYRAGEPADMLYIINRGMVEIVQETPKHGAAATYLSRGDIFGDLEVLTNRPRQQIARTCEPVSVQCFRREDFAELLRLVPSFFRYLCEQLAHRLVDARNADVLQSHCLELSGSLTKFDLVTIYQTIVHSSQTGQLSIVHEEGGLIAAFHFKSGQPWAGHFQHLTGEEAFWQLFLAGDLRGTFSFTCGEQERMEPPDQTIARKADDMLIAAVQFRDEFQQLKGAMPACGIVELQKPSFTLGCGGTEILPALMEQIWRYCAEHKRRLADLYPYFPVCELKIYEAVRELIQTGHLALSADDESQKVA